MIDSWKLEAYLSASWVDISGDVHGSIFADWGIKGNEYFDRMASPGEMKFDLINTGGEYSPGHASCTAGWQLNVPILLTLTFDSIDYLYRYYVNSIDVVPGVYGERIAIVTAMDWLNYAAELPFRLQNIQLNRTADQLGTTLLGALPIAPLNTSFDTGETTFLTGFDTVTKNTRALGELNKIVMSELGWCYLTKNTSTDGETLVLKNMSGRKGTDSLTSIPVVIY